jgi:hypothetical protein
MKGGFVLPITFGVGDAKAHSGKVAVLECDHATTTIDVIGTVVDPEILLMQAAARHSETCKCGSEMVKAWEEKKRAQNG